MFTFRGENYAVIQIQIMGSKGWAWDYVNILDHQFPGISSNRSGSKKWECNYCNTLRLGSFSRVRAHLLGLEREGVKICPAIDESLREHFRILDEKGLSNKRKRKFEDENPRERITTPQPNIESVPRTISKKEVESSIARFFIAEDLDLNLIESRYFPDMCKAIAAFEHGFEFHPLMSYPIHC